MLQLRNGTRLEGDDEIVFRTVDLEQAAGDGLYADDVAEASGLPVERVREVLAGLVASEALALGYTDDQLGPRYVTSRAV